MPVDHGTQFFNCQLDVCLSRNVDCGQDESGELPEKVQWLALDHQTFKAGGAGMGHD